VRAAAFDQQGLGEKAIREMLKMYLADDVDRFVPGMRSSGG